LVNQAGETARDVALTKGHNFSSSDFESQGDDARNGMNSLRYQCVVTNERMIIAIDCQFADNRGRANAGEEAKFFWLNFVIARIVAFFVWLRAYCRARGSRQLVRYG
jgi:hypothetical protein